MVNFAALLHSHAINKVQGTGYRIEDIEREEKSNCDIFEIEAKSG